MYVTIFILFIIILIMSLREGVVLKWTLNGHPAKLSSIWHSLGMTLRALIVLFAIYQLFPNWQDMILAGLLGLNWTWTIYDLCINWINEWKLWYTGKTSDIEVKLKSKIIWILKAILFVITIIYIIIYYTIF